MESEKYFGQRQDWLGNSMSYPMGRRRFGKGIPDEEHFLQERVSDKELFPVEREKGDGELWFARAKIRGFHGVSEDDLEKL